MALGLLAAVVASGCGSDASGQGAVDQVQPAEPAAAVDNAITSRSILANGCTATGVFDIFSSFRKVRLAAVDH